VAIITPTWELASEMKQKCKNMVIEEAVRYALHKALATERTELFVNSLIPSDLGLASWVTPEQKAFSSIHWVDYELPAKVLVLFKIVQLSENPGIEQINLSSNCYKLGSYPLSTLYGLVPLLKKIKDLGDLAILQVQYGLENLRMEGWLNEPIIIGPHELCKVELVTYSHETAGDNLVLGGYVIQHV
jgi:hypothetical protein